MIRNVIVLGEHIQALGLTRMLNKLGYSVDLYINYKLAISRFSNTIKNVTLYKDKADLHKKLNNSFKGEKDTLIIPTSDQQINILSENYDDVNKKYYLSIAPPYINTLCQNKILTYKTAIAAGVQIPDSYFPSNKSEVEKISNRIQYPIILKPAYMFKFYNKTGKKVIICNNKRELLENYDDMIRTISPEEVIIQDFLQGGPNNLFSFGAFAAEGIIYGGFAANRIRQKPMDFGISTCYAKSINIPELENEAVKILKHMNYFGFAEVEFMFNNKSNKFMLLEINPRTWKWHSMANILNINLVELMIKYLNNEEVVPKIVRTPDKAWIERVTDTYIVISELIKGHMNIKEYFNSMKLEKESAVWSYKDPLPAIMYLLLTPYLIFKR